MFSFLSVFIVYSTTQLFQLYGSFLFLWAFLIVCTFSTLNFFLVLYFYVFLSFEFKCKIHLTLDFSGLKPN